MVKDSEQKEAVNNALIKAKYDPVFQLDVG